jgi:branched-chain amino acid transport system substrate-binding protein
LRQFFPFQAKLRNQTNRPFSAQSWPWMKLIGKEGDGTNSTTLSPTAIGDPIFRVCYDDTLQDGVLARLAFEELEARTALVFVDIASNFSLNLTEIFNRSFQSPGGKIIREIEYKTLDSDYLPQVQEALTADTDIVFLSGDNKSGVIAIKLQDAGSKATPIGSDGRDNAGFLYFRR